MLEPGWALRGGGRLVLRDEIRRRTGVLDPARPPGDAADEIVHRARVGAGQSDQDVEAGDVFATLDLVELRAGESGALGRLLLIETRNFPGAVDVVGEPRQGLEGKGRLPARDTAAAMSRATPTSPLR